MTSLDDDSRVTAILDSVDVFSQLLTLNSAIEHARDEIEVPFSIDANRVTEHAHAIGRHRLRSVGAPVAKAVELGQARAAVLASCDPADTSTDQLIAAETFAAEGLGR